VGTQGNPFCLLAAYPSYVLSKLPQLEHFDGKAVLPTAPATQIGIPESKDPPPGRGGPDECGTDAVIGAWLEVTLAEILPSAELVTDRLPGEDPTSGTPTGAGSCFLCLPMMYGAKFVQR
jgi:hypothetical protein